MSQPELPSESARLPILLVANNDEYARLISGVLAAANTPRFEVTHAASAWEAQRQAADGEYAALVLDDSLRDTDGETLRRRLRAMGIVAPALLLTPTGVGIDALSETEALNGTSLVRAIVAMLERHDLTAQLAEVRAQAERSRTVLTELIHDLATPLGVVLGLTQILLSEDNGLNPDGRECLTDVAREALRATQILKALQPVKTDAATLPPRVTRVPDDVPAKSPRPGGQMVLIADDDAATRRLVCATLASSRYSVLEAADGKEAWRLIREHHPAVAILDWQMPIYSGLELTDVIKGDPLVRDMTVIMLTGRSEQADRDAGARAHADLYLTKPFLPHELLAAVEQALGIA